MGHEGNLGIITEAVLRIRPIPELSRHNSIIFPDYDTGVQFMHEVATSRNWPASCRLVDNIQFQFSQALKPQADSKAEEIIDAIKKFFVVNIKGYDPAKMVACTMLFEGTKDHVIQQEK